METGKQIASMGAWRALTDVEQLRIVQKAARKAVYVASAYGVRLTANELIGATWIGIIDRLDADRLDKANAKTESPLTIGQIAFRAAHGAAEIQRYDFNKHDNLSLESLEAVDSGSVEDEVITRIMVKEFTTGRDAVDKLILEMLPKGYAERQIGVTAKMSGTAVHKRIDKMRKAIREIA